MAGDFQPLDQKFPIVDDQGRPTRYFTEWAQQKQIDIGDAITLQDVIDYLTAHKLVEGTGIQFTPDGDINNSPTIAADVQEILDQITATRGAILYRGLLGWSALLPGTAGLFLQTTGPGADPVWAATGGGGGGGSTPTLRTVPAPNIVTTATTTVAWPVGTIAGDAVFIFISHAFSTNIPAGWTVYTNDIVNANLRGTLIGKIMTAADITAGSVVITFGGAFNGIAQPVTVQGTTLSKITDVDYFQNSATVAAVPIRGFRPASGNLILGFAANRNTSTNTLGANWTTLKTQNATNGSSVLGQYIIAPPSIGIEEAATCSAAAANLSFLLSLQGP